MPRIRTVKPEFWSDEKIGSLNYFERLLFIGLLSFADDEGLIKSNPVFLRSSIFPYNEINVGEMVEAINTLKNMDLVFEYTQNNQKYLWIIKFRVHQRIDKPQRPTNPCPSIQNPEFRDAIYRRDRFICHICGCDTAYGEPINECNSKAPSIDHLTPKSKGGPDFPSNLKTACLACNKSRGNKPLCVFQECSKNDIGIVLDGEVKGKGKGKGIGEGKDKDLVSEKPPQKTENLILPDYVDKKTWDDFCEMRKKIKKPLTEVAIPRMLKKLERFNSQGFDVNDILNDSITNSWQGVFEPKRQNANNRKDGLQRTMDLFARRERERQECERREAAQGRRDPDQDVPLLPS